MENKTLNAFRGIEKWTEIGGKEREREGIIFMRGDSCEQNNINYMMELFPSIAFFLLFVGFFSLSLSIWFLFASIPVG